MHEFCFFTWNNHGWANMARIPSVYTFIRILCMTQIILVHIICFQILCRRHNFFLMARLTVYLGEDAKLEHTWFFMSFQLLEAKGSKKYKNEIFAEMPFSWDMSHYVKKFQTISHDLIIFMSFFQVFNVHISYQKLFFDEFTDMFLRSFQAI